MVPVTVFEVNGEYGVLPPVEIDASDDLEVIHEFIRSGLIEPRVAFRLPLAGEALQASLAGIYQGHTGLEDLLRKVSEIEITRPSPPAFLAQGTR